MEIGEEVLAIFTMPSDRAPHISAHASFGSLGQQYGVPVYETADINTGRNLAIMQALEPEIIYVIGWPQLVKRSILDLPPKGCIGIHSSLLPKYRGGAPVNWGLINGESSWGISLMYLEDGPDTGDIIAQESFPVTIEDTCKTVYDKATEASLNVLKKFIPLLAKGEAPRNPQDDSQATLYRQRKPYHGVVDWNKTALELFNWVRALTHPYPGAFTYLPDGRKFFIWEAALLEEELKDTYQDSPPGTIQALLPYRGIVIRTGQGKLILKQVQVVGEIEMSGTVWAVHNPQLVGSRLRNSDDLQELDGKDRKNS